jgi:hypothetical protein
LNNKILIHSIRKALKEHYSPLSFDRQIHDLISLEDKKTLYELVINRDTKSLTSKMNDITMKVVNVLGDKSKKYVQDYLNRMVYKMYITYTKKMN